jgi:hypothetical protein
VLSLAVKKAPYSNFTLEHVTNVTAPQITSILDHFWELNKPENALVKILSASDVVFAIYGTSKLICVGEVETAFPELVKVVPVELQHSENGQNETVSKRKPKRQKTAVSSIPHLYNFQIPDGLSIRCFAVGSEGRFYIKLSNGKTYHHASEAFAEDIVPIFVSQDENDESAARIEYCSKFVAFGPTWESYLITYENGMSSWQNIPKTLHNALIRKEKKNAFINELAIVPDWGWFAQFSDFSYESKEASKELTQALQQIEEDVGVIKQVQFFGETADHFTVLFQKPNFSKPKPTRRK